MALINLGLIPLKNIMSNYNLLLDEVFFKVGFDLYRSLVSSVSEFKKLFYLRLTTDYFIIYLSSSIFLNYVI